MQPSLETDARVIHKPASLALIALILAGPISANAQSRYPVREYSQTPTSTVLDVTLGATRSDNVRRTSTDEVEDTLASVGLLSDVARKGVRLDYSLKSDVSWFEYLDDTYDGVPGGYLDGFVRVGIVPERISWNFADTFDQASIDSFSALTPENQQSVNYFSTGPQFDFPLGSSTRATVRADYSVVTSSSQAQQSVDLDSERYSGSLTLTRDISNLSSVFLAAETERVKFDDSTSNVDYDRTYGYVGYGVAGARTTLNATLGYTQIGGDSEASGGWSGRLELSRRISPASTGLLYASREIADSVGMSRTGPTRGTSITSPTQVAATDVFVNEQFGAGWGFRMAHTNAALGATFTKEIHDLDPTLDRKIRAVDASFEREITPLLRLILDARYERQDTDSSSLEVKRIEGTAGLTWRIGRRVGLSFLYEYFDQDSSVTADIYKENRIGLTLVYHALSQSP